MTNTEKQFIEEVKALGYEVKSECGETYILNGDKKVAHYSKFTGYVNQLKYMLIPIK